MAYAKVTVPGRRRLCAVRTPLPLASSRMDFDVAFALWLYTAFRGDVPEFVGHGAGVRK